MPEDIVRNLGYLTLGTRFKRISERLQADTQQILVECGIDIPSAQFPFLASIDRIGPLKIGELATAVGVTQPGATRTVGLLVEAGLLSVSSSRTDRREKTVALTMSGKRLVAKGKRLAWLKIERAVRDVCHHLSGALLDQLTALEDSLDMESLSQRAASIQIGRK